MKEEAPSKKMPRKATGASASTPTKTGSDEILSALLRSNNFDSSIKDESLDIDLSACVTINGNSLSCTDFWRVLDESAQNAQLEISSESTSSRDANGDSQSHCVAFSAAINTSLGGIKSEQQSSFQGNFLRPEPPTSSALSPVKKKTMPTTQQVQQKRRLSISSPTGSPFKIITSVKREPAEHFHLLANDDARDEIINDNNLISESDDLELPRPQCSPPLDTKMRFFKRTPEEAGRVVLEPLYKCLDCNGLLLHGEQQLANHSAASHRVHYKCNACERFFEQETAMKKHAKTHRSVESRKDAWKKCPDCGKCLKLGSMWMHRKIHSDNKKYGCEICGQKFVQKINLTHHSRVHTAEKPYECPECQKRFQERSHLQRHQKYHAQTRSYRCDKCGKMYKTERCLKVHNLVHLEQRPFACNVCEKSFISNSKLKQHSNIHTGERPFKCNYCPRDFTNFPNWLKHTRRRHKVDHKTGEHLENIPSYCSKKSAKTTKAKKTTETNKNTTEQTADQPGNSGVLEVQQPSEDTTTKAPAKRKKKAAPVQATETIASNDHAQQEQRELTNENNTSNQKTTKIKRERKQPSPKQVHKFSPVIASPTELADMNATITDTKIGIKSFPDLSITSAEDLIMEQALEMEESGFYAEPSANVSALDDMACGNAASSMHFKIKSEIIDEERNKAEIYVRDINNRLLCSSLETSPFSSPASVELASSATGAVPQKVAEIQNTTLFLNSFPPRAQESSTANGAIQSLLSSATNIPALQQLNLQSDPMSLGSTVRLPTAQALINHFYLRPITMTNQVLPSVDTLLFPMNANSNFFHGKNSPKAAQHKLS